MAKYIEREAAMDIFGDVPMWQGYYEPYPWEVHCAIVGIVKLLKEEISKIPAADVVPVSELLTLRDALYENDQITMRGLARLNMLIAKYGGYDHG